MPSKTPDKDIYYRYDLALNGAVEWFSRKMLHASLDHVVEALGNKFHEPDEHAQDVLAHLDREEWRLKEEAKSMLDSIRPAVSITDLDPTTPKQLAGMLDFPWDEERYLQYLSEYGSIGFRDRIYDEDAIPELMGVVEGIHIGIDGIEGLIALLDAGKEVPNIYFYDDQLMLFIPRNHMHVVQVENQVYGQLTDHTERIVKLRPLDKETIIANEIAMFQPVFTSGVDGTDVAYLSRRLDLPEYDVTEIIKKRHDVLDGGLVRGYFTYDQELRVDYGILLGMQAYLTYLRAGMKHPEAPPEVVVPEMVQPKEDKPYVFEYTPGDNLTLKNHNDEDVRRQVSNIRDGLKELGLIPTDTNGSVVSSVFSDRMIKTPITWTGTQYELHFLIKRLRKHMVSNSKGAYSRAEKLFIKQDGSKFQNLMNAGGGSTLRPQLAEKYTLLLDRAAKNLR